MVRRIGLILLTTLFLSGISHAVSVRRAAASTTAGAAGTTVDTNYLYKDDREAVAASIVEYTEDGENNFDVNDDVPRIVEFYDPFCGVCQALKPTYIKLAKEAKDTKKQKKEKLPSDLQFHTVSCRTNSDVCSKYGINSYPTLIALPPKAKAGTEKDAVKVKRALIGRYTLQTLSDALTTAGEGSGKVDAASNLKDGKESSTSRRLAGLKGGRAAAGQDDDDVKSEEDDNGGRRAAPATGAGGRNLPAAGKKNRMAQKAEKAAEGAGGNAAARVSSPAGNVSFQKKTTSNAAAAAAVSGRKAATASNGAASGARSGAGAGAGAFARASRGDDEGGNNMGAESERQGGRVTNKRQQQQAVSSTGRKTAVGGVVDQDEEEVEASDAEGEGGAAGRPAARFGSFGGGQRGAAAVAEKDDEDEDEDEDEEPANASPRKAYPFKKVVQDEDTDEDAETARDAEDGAESVGAAGRHAAATTTRGGRGGFEPAAPKRAFPAARRAPEAPNGNGKDDDDDDDNNQDDDDNNDDEPEESKEENDSEQLAGRPPPGQIRQGAVANPVPNPLKLAQTGMQPRDIEQYQALLAKRRAEAAKRQGQAQMQRKAGAPFRPLRNKGANGPGGGPGGFAGPNGGANRTPAEQAKIVEERKQKAKELLQKRLELAKKIREEKKLKDERRVTSPRKQPPPSKFTPPVGGGAKPPRGVAAKTLSKIPVANRLVKSHAKPEEELYGDAALSFIAGLKTGVYGDDRPLDEKRKKALVDWLELLSVSLPPELGLHNLIDDLLNNINYISQKRENLQTQIDKYPLANKFWSPSCSKNRAGQGNNCGLWKLLHIMTVGFAEQRGGLELYSDARTFTPAEAAGVVREYVALFFGCTVCRNNFISKFDDGYSFRRTDRMPEDTSVDSVEDDDWKEFPLWLWEFHNHISVRIVQVKAKRDSAADGKPKNDDEVMGVWPTMDDCFTCYKEDGSLNLEELYHYLEMTYWHASTDLETDRALKEYEHTTRRASGKSSFRSYAGFGIVLLAVYFAKRRKVLLSGFNKKFDTNPFGARSAAAGKKA